MKTCKNCGSESNNGTNFCKRKCRLDYMRSKEIKGSKKKAERAYENALMGYGNAFDVDGNSYPNS